MEHLLNVVNTVNPKHRASLVARFGLELPLAGASVQGESREHAAVEQVATEAFQSYYGNDAVCKVRIGGSLEESLSVFVGIEKTFTDTDWTTTWETQHRVSISSSGTLYHIDTDLFLHSAASTCSGPNTDIQMTRRTDCSFPPASDVLSACLNVGKMVEQVESKMRSELVDFYGKRVIDFCQDVRYLAGPGGDGRDRREQLAAELCEKFY